MRGTNLEILSSSEFNTTSRIMQSGTDSVSVNVNRNGHNGGLGLESVSESAQEVLSSFDRVTVRVRCQYTLVGHGD